MRLPFHAGHTLGLGAALLLPIGLFAHRGIAPLVAVVALLTLLTWIDRRPTRAAVVGPLMYATGALCAVAFVSVLWSITPGVSLETGFGLQGAMVSGIVLVATAATLTPTERTVAVTWIGWAGAVGFAVMAVDLFLGAPFHSLMAEAKGRPITDPYQAAIFMNPGASVAAIFVWCWAGAVAIRGRRWAALLLLLPAAVTISRVQAETPIAGMLVGAVCVVALIGLMAVARRWTGRLAAAGLAVYVVGFPLAVGALPHVYEIAKAAPAVSQDVAEINASIYHRISIWQTAVMHISESPVLGLGFDTTRALYGAEDRISYNLVGEDGQQLMASYFEPIPLHTHNAVLQVWLELGIAGVAALLVILVVLFNGVVRVYGSPAFVFAAGAYCTGLAIASISFGVWQSWWMCALIMILALTRCLDDRVSGASP